MSVTVAKGVCPGSGAWLSSVSGVGIAIGSILPLRSVSFIAIAIPSGAVTEMATSFSGICAKLE